MRQLIPEKINTMLDDIVTKCFAGNRIADRGMSVLAVKFVMNKTEDILHEKLAHLFPQIADIVSTYQGSRGNLTVYGNTPLDDTDYDSPLDFFEKMVDYMIELEGMVCIAIDETREYDNFTYSFLLELVEEIRPISEQCLLLLDKATEYDGDWQSFDFRVCSFVIL